MSFSLLVELKSDKIDWAKINKETRAHRIDGIEVFPIPAYPILNKSCIGISIVAVNARVAASLQKIIEYFLKEENKVFELYNSNEFSKTNVEFLISKFLG